MTKKSVLVVSTGGTIIMKKTAKGYAPAPNYLQEAMAKIPELTNPDMPDYTVQEFDKTIDSANITPDNWIQIAETIFKNYQQYDGFVILHGTDTMAYTASALSFMLENLGKPVILTGSQLPLFETRSDARENLINAIFIAGMAEVPEVCVYFNNRLFRGNRAKKMDATSFSAFASPNYPVLGKVGTDVLIRHTLVLGKAKNEFSFQTIHPLVAGALRIFPGMSLEMLQHFLKKPLQAVVMETFGLGNAPENPEFLALIRRAVDDGMVIVNCSQCPVAKVKMKEYAAGTALMQTGVISGGDMTAEATLAKLFYLFSKKLSLPEIKAQLVSNLRGELTL